MQSKIVYHGGTEIIERPICSLGRPNLDFGQGFYVTDIREQAVSWAKLVADKRGVAPIINTYMLDYQAVKENYRCKIFRAYDAEWLEFIVANRSGRNLAANYDFVEGGVANDRVIDTVNLYMAGLMELSTALRRLSAHQPNNQICILTQTIIDNHLVFNGTEWI